jgi:large subunit ribosomal protein L35
MSKFKVKKAAKKRYKQTSNKKFIRKKAFKSHILEKKTTKRKRRLSNLILIKNVDLKAIRKMLNA